MEPVYIIAIVVGILILILFCACLCLMGKKRRKAEEDRKEQDAVYSDPELAKMEYDVAYYDEEAVAKLAASAQSKTVSQVTIEEVLANKESPDAAGSSDTSELPATVGRTAEEEAIYNKPEDGMEEISGSFEPEKGGEE